MLYFCYYFYEQSCLSQKASPMRGGLAKLFYSIWPGSCNAVATCQGHLWVSSFSWSRDMTEIFYFQAPGGNPEFSGPRTRRGRRWRGSRSSRRSANSTWSRSIGFDNFVASQKYWVTLPTTPPDAASKSATASGTSRPRANSSVSTFALRVRLEKIKRSKAAERASRLERRATRWSRTSLTRSRRALPEFREMMLDLKTKCSLPATSDFWTVPKSPATSLSRCARQWPPLEHQVTSFRTQKFEKVIEVRTKNLPYLRIDFF